MSRKPDPDPHTIYQIKLQGHLDPSWEDWFDGFRLTPSDNGDTLLTGPVADQAALHGLLKKVCDLGLPLISVCRVGPAGVDDSGGNPAATRPTKEEREGEPFL